MKVASNILMVAFNIQRATFDILRVIFRIRLENSKIIHLVYSFNLKSLWVLITNLNLPIIALEIQLKDVGFDFKQLVEEVVK